MNARSLRPRVAHWLWWSHHLLARVARVLLLPPALLHRGVMLVRASAYQRGWLATRTLPLPAVAIGNLAVGGAGETPVAAWGGAVLAPRGPRPGLLFPGHRGAPPPRPQ